ncbi:histidine phosphatase family protein [Xylophilus sp. GW821-FHT01B05]
MSRLWLARHAQPLVAPGICYGRLDMAADAAATMQAANALAMALPAGCHVFTSPQQRCQQLATALHAQRPDLQPVTDERLREFDFGSWEGRAWDSIGAAAMDAWTADFARHAPGGGETVEALLARVGAAFEASRVLAEVAWITHAGVIRAATLWAAGRRSLDSAADWPATAPGFGAWTMLAI